MKKQFLVILAAALAMGLSASCDTLPRGPYTTLVTGVTLDRTTLEMTIGDPDVKLTATVVPENATDKTVSWSSDKPEFATVDQEGNVHAVAAGVATITVTTTDGGKTAACTVTVKDYVIIGGLKWAKKNIGAEKETDYGYYFFWGGTVGYVYDSVNSKWVKASDGAELSGGFTWSNTPFNNGSTSFDNTYFNGVKDTECPEGILATKNDAAAVYCGAGWRMPTVEDFTALANACKEGYVAGGITPNKSVNPSGASASVAKGIYWCTSYDGVAGLLFCDGTNRLFFPAAGYGYSTSLDGTGIFATYWLSRLYTTNMSNAYYLYFIDSLVNPRAISDRNFALSVRPVSDIN